MSPSFRLHVDTTGLSFTSTASMNINDGSPRVNEEEKEEPEELVLPGAGLHAQFHSQMPEYTPRSMWGLVFA